MSTVSPPPSPEPIKQTDGVSTPKATKESPQAQSSTGTTDNEHTSPNSGKPTGNDEASKESPSKQMNGLEACPEKANTLTIGENSTSAAEGIRWIQRDVSEQPVEKEWEDPRKSEAFTDQTDWLRVKKITKGAEVSYTLTILDRKLLQRIYDIIGAYIDHTGKGQWKENSVTLRSTSPTIIYHFTKLKTAVERAESNQTNRRLEEFLSVFSSLIDTQLIEPFPLYQDPRDVQMEFRYLWPVFRLGGLVVSSMHGGELPQVFRVDGFDNVIKQGARILTVSAWIWDWNGQGLIRSMYNFPIPSYTADNTSKALIDLPCYPVELYKGDNGKMGTEALAELYSSQRRELFLKYTAEQELKNDPLCYSGSAFGDAPGFPSASVQEAQDKRSENKLITLDEDIVLDSETYLRRVGDGRRLGTLEPMQGTRREFCKCGLCMSPLTEAWVKTINAVFKAKREDFEEARQTAMEFPLTDDDLLLSPRVFGFALNRKHWCQFSLDRISPKPIVGVDDEGNISGLVLPSKIGSDQKKDIHKLVSSHRRLMGRRRQERLADTISGKGDSLLLLFHGHSGTGKTLYAESLAASCGLALFRVGANDLGLEASHAERRLKDIFALAAVWSAVLLIDEADVFLDARGRENESLVSKNALVSVLLREVEYFRGVLVMTTNRVRAFDPAVLSRIHHAVDFEEPNAEQELALWVSWHERLKAGDLCTGEKEILKWMKDTNKRKKRNFLCGREVRNVVLVAQSLAEQEDSTKIKITRDHLETAYNYKLEFLQETEDKMRQAKAMVMSGARADGF